MSRATLKQLALTWLVCLSAVFAASCIVGPDYHAPKVQIPNQWAGLSTDSTGNPSTATAEAIQITDWWKTFHDEELDSLVLQAVQSNLNLQQAHTRILQAREARAIAGAGFWPSATASGSITSSSLGSGLSSSTGGNSGGPTSNLFRAGLDAAWELDFFGGVRRGIEAANSNYQAAIEDSRDVMVTLTAEVARNYIELRGFQQELAIAGKNLEAQKQTAALTRKRFTVGFAGGLDVANAEAQVSTTQAQIPVLEASAQQTIYALSVLLGREPSALAADLSPERAIPDTPPVVPIGLPSDLLERRPDIRRTEAQLHSATAQIGVATADLFPKFSLTGSIGGQDLTTGSLGSIATHFWSVGPSISLPVFNAGKIRANIRLLNAVQQQTLLEYKQTVLTALQDVESALIAYTKDQQHRAALSAAVKSNERAVDLSRRLYAAGESEFLNFLIAQRNLYTSEDALVQSYRTVDTDLIALYKALGGGWE
jgi:outer membrane protein, multidrug efflux system